MKQLLEVKAYELTDITEFNDAFVMLVDRLFGDGWYITDIDYASDTDYESAKFQIYVTRAD